MTAFEEFVGALGAPLLLLAIAAWIIWDRRRLRRRLKPVTDGPSDEPYKIYTRAFDLEIGPAQIPVALREGSPDRLEGWVDRDATVWNRAIEAADRARDALAIGSMHQSLVARLTERQWTGVAVTLLVDQSGSLRGQPIASLAAALASVATAFEATAIPFEILGFSTAGWRGGFSFKQWWSKGRPARPGRLCALLHIVYKDFDEPCWTAESRRAFLHPEILRENVDGEALEWASMRLSRSTQPHKFLIIISDGAPVDDMTLLENGDSYLERHLVRTIAAIEGGGVITVGAVGVEHMVDRYYPASRRAELNGIGEAVVDVLIGLMDAPVIGPGSSRSEDRPEH